MSGDPLMDAMLWAAQPRPLICKDEKQAAWLIEHMNHMPGIEVTYKGARCLGCGARNHDKFDLRAQERTGRVTESDVGRPDD